MSEIEPGAVFELDHPFTRERSMVGWDDEGAMYANSWCPGVRFEPIGPEESGAFADGVGKQILTIVSTHRPGKYPLRIFYTRQWIAPNGKRFGKDNLHIRAIQSFRQLIKGYRYTYEIADQEAA